MKATWLALVGLMLAGCATSGHQRFYTPYADARTLPNVALLESGQKPLIYLSKNLDQDVKILQSKGYQPIGHSSFNGAHENDSQVIAQATRIGASVALVASNYTNTETNTVPLLLPNSTTTYGSGSVYGSGGYAAFRGSSTTYGTSVVPITYQQQRYDQTAVYFVKSTKKLKYGLILADLPPGLRVAIQRNAGALVDVVAEDSPAFYANVLPGDILIVVDGVEIRNAQHATEVLKTSSPPNGESALTIIRGGNEKTITVHVGGT